MAKEQQERKRRSRQAAALSYQADRGDTVPKVVALGQGSIADNIIAKAKEAGVPIQADPELVSSLCQIELGSPIPPELYEAVARLLAFVLYLDAEMGKQLSRSARD